MAEPKLNLGRKISKIRELRGIKQEALATLLGVSQQAISKIEQSDEVEDLALEKIAQALGVTSEGIKNFNEEAVFNIIGNNYHDNSSSVQYQCTFNPIDKLIEVYEENKKLYEQLLQSEREKVELLKNQK
jgi:transcriptional regulator with XRE-family HTH domain